MSAQEKSLWNHPRDIRLVKENSFKRLYLHCEDCIRSIEVEELPVAGGLNARGLFFSTT
jgi:hypothetical protein